MCIYTYRRIEVCFESLEALAKYRFPLTHTGSKLGLVDIAEGRTQLGNTRIHKERQRSLLSPVSFSCRVSYFS